MPKSTIRLLDKDIYGQDHPLIGMPCLYEGRPALPYGCSTTDKVYEPDDDGIRLAILYYDPEGISEGKSVYVKALAGVRPANLIALNPCDARYRLVSRQVLSWLANNRCGTNQCERRHAASQAA
jgi:hypothetical protein